MCHSPVHVVCEVPSTLEVAAIMSIELTPSRERTEQRAEPPRVP